MTHKYMHKPIKMRRMPDCGFEKVGDFCWVMEDNADGPSKKRVLWIATPALNANGWVHTEWTIRPAKAPNGSSWDWNGDDNEPTLQPSLHHVGMWHGHVRQGYLVEA